jgi:adenylosuccinate synthase|nr:MAG TPA: adenylosuccinate synthetase [Caudoviricetes sp.]
MKDIKIVIGANFGDCGKGLMTDYFSQKPNSIVVCSNGGAQRGHTVTTSDGIRHVFHHFGSGTFNHASTYLSEDFIVNPIIFKQEYDELMNLGYIPNVYINQNCMLTTPFDMMANQIIEESRGKNKHGSCGLGIFETIKRYKAGITDVDNHIREYYLDQFERENIVLTDEWSRIFFDNGIFEHFLDDWDFMNNHSLVISDNYFLNQFDNIVFEAAQGLLLDQNNTEYFPHLTPSNTGIKNPKRIIENVEWNDEINIETCYVSRTYLTRHGAGKFPSECNKRFINEYMFDKTNVPNPFQDTLRYGTLDLGELYSRCSKDIGNFGDKKSIAITHFNEYDWDNDKLIELFKDWNIYYSDGETHNDVN